MNLEKNGESGLKTVRSFLGKMGTRQWVILLLLGLLLTVIALPVSDKKGENSSGKGQSTGIFTDTASDDAEVQRTALEEKLEDLLSKVEGVGEVRVVLMTGENPDSQSFYSSGKENVTGVLIAAQGADNSVVSRNIVEAVMALFQVDAHKIRVMKMK